jgi:NTP pyrophosphatase (non-canonical NTP hydrolase)|tara:strand:- start:54 stop:458 length:405 start_codon:yes stop_codon:yes gene_type:complete
MDSKEVIDHRDFVNGVTSEATVDSDAFMDRLAEFQDGDMIWTEPQRLLTGGIGICSEGGELLDLVKKLLFQGKEPTPELREKIKLELGDVMWYVQQVLIWGGWSLNEVLAENTKKLSGRYPEGFSVDKSENRED